jgi:hypothetical protein
MIIIIIFIGKFDNNIFYKLTKNNILKILKIKILLPIIITFILKTTPILIIIHLFIPSLLFSLI